MSSSSSTLGGSGGGGVTALIDMLLSTMIGRSPIIMEVCTDDHCNTEFKYLTHRLS